MKLTRMQDAALKCVDAWMKRRYSPFLSLAGYAGTGKTTLAKYLAQNVEGHVLFGAYTGKAALVLRQKGCVDATTIHRMIYLAKDKSRLRLRELEAELARTDENDTHKQNELMLKIMAERENLAQPAFTLNPDSEVQSAALVIIDEGSMIDGRIGEDLLSFGKPVLVLNDPAQLPPVRGSGFFTKREPDIMLTDIHRQAKDNPIIRLATEVRNQRGLEAGTYGDSEVVEGRRLTPEEVLAADQVIVGRNKTRHASNARFRELLGYEGSALPVKGDRLVCLRNDHEVGVLNGSLWETTSDAMLGDEGRMYMTVSPYQDEGDEIDLEAWTAPFLGTTQDIGWWQRKEAQEFDYGYALTCHKAQGSQWSKVVVYDESGCFRADRWKWLYTAITRASERVTVVQ